MFAYRRILLLLVVPFLFLGLESCNSQQDELLVTIQYPKEFTGFSFRAANNPSLRSDVIAELGADSVTATLPYGTLQALKPSFTVHQGNLVTVNGVRQVSGVTVQDFSQPVQYTLSNGGGSKSYRVTLEPILIGGGWQNQQLNIPANGGVVSTLAGDGTAATLDGALASAQLNGPFGVTTDGSAVYVCEFFGNVIRKIDLNSGTVSTLAGQAGVAGSADGIATAATFNGPAYLILAGTDLYVSDLSNHLIRKIDTLTDEVTTLAGQAGVSGGADGIGTAASFTNPAGLAFDGTHLFVSEYGGNRVRKIDLTTAEVSLLAGSGVAGVVDGVGSAAQFYWPITMTGDDQYLYVGSEGGFTLRKIDIATGEVTSVAGDGVQTITDGIATSAQVGIIAGMTLDRDYLYFMDSDFLRKMNLTTFEVITLAGSSPGGYVNGVGTVVKFDQARGLTADDSAIYVGGFADYRIRKVTN